MQLWLSRQERFARRYAGREAAQYESARAGAKWATEETVFDQLYARVAPRTVLDCPVGTGRFLDRYIRDGVAVLGVDLSDDMLAQAADKLPPGSGVRLVRADVLDAAQTASLGRDHDLIVCVRFVYGVEKRRLPLLFRNFQATGARHLLVGVRLWPPGTGWGEYLRWHFWNADRKRPRWRGRFNRYIPTEARLHALFEATGWEVLERRPVEENDPVGRYFYLLRNQGA
jgi:hypothetical protein